MLAAATKYSAKANVLKAEKYIQKLHFVHIGEKLYSKVNTAKITYDTYRNL